ncbi:MAG: hypothetical protein QME78_00110 [Thermodesulfobacteriota bacterium]|nr:hypothetical protein [Thermodesulfobacteriota bacterium]
MALAWASGAELGLANLELTNYGGGTQIWNINSTDKRTGAYCFRTYGSADYLHKVLDSALSEFYLQFANKGGGINRVAFKWRKGTTVLGTLKINTAGKFELYTGDSVTLVATGTATFNTDVWTLLELYIKIADSGGVLTLRVNGISDASFTGDTKPGTDTTVDSLFWAGTSNAVYVYIDDIILFDTTGTVNNSWPNNLKVGLLQANGAGNSTQWTPSAGSNWSCVYAIPPSDVDYVKVNVVDRIDLYTLGDLPAEAKGIHALFLTARASKEGAPNVNNLQLALRTGGANYFSASKALPTVPGMLVNIWEQNPGTAAGWQASEVNALEIGLKSIA